MAMATDRRCGKWKGFWSLAALVVLAMVGGADWAWAQGPPADPTNSTVTASPTSLTADGSSTSTITIQLKDSSNNNFSASGGTVTMSTNTGTVSSPATDNGDGTYTATFTAGTGAGTATITATVSGMPPITITNQATVTLTAGAASATTSTISASPTSIAANGSSTSTITVQLNDANSNNLSASGGTVTLSTTLGTLSSVTNNNNGTYTATLTSGTTTGTATISGTLNTVAITGTASVTLTSAATAPGAPMITGITPASGQLSVAFTAGSTGGAAISNYQYSTGSGAPFVAASPAVTSSPLVITGLTNGTSYQVQLKAVNSVGAGTASEAVSGTPVGVPGSPTITGITAGNGQLSVAFTAPGSDGGAAISNYQYSTDSGAPFVAASPAVTSSPLVITGLTNGTSYPVQLKAVNSVGAGTASEAVRGTPATTPGVPTGVTAEAGNRQVRVSFTEPSSNGGSPITSYTVTVSSGTAGAVGTSSFSTIGSPYTVDNLTNGATYSFKVTATNGVGTGGDASASATPQAPPTAAFYYSPAPVEAGTKVTFTNSSAGSYYKQLWTFPDLQGTINEAKPVVHTFEKGGTYTVSLEVEGAGGTSTKTADITVIDPQPRMRVEVSSLDLGSAKVGESASKTLTIGNEGNGDLHLSFKAAAPFQVVGPATVLAKQSGTVTVNFAPTREGDQKGTLEISSNELAKPKVSVDLKGTGAGTPQIKLFLAVFGLQELSNDAPVSLGNLDVGQRGPMRLAIANPGTGTLTISSISLEGGEGQFSVTPDQGTLKPTEKPDDYLIVNVDVHPTLVGEQKARLSIKSDGGNLTIPLSVTGVGNPKIGVAASPQPFPETLVGTKAQPQILTLASQGEKPLFIYSVGVEGEDQDDFSVEPNNFSQSVPLRVEAGQSVDLKVTFAPRSADAQSRNPKEKKASLVIVANAPRTADKKTRVGLSGMAKGAPMIGVPGAIGTIFRWEHEGTAFSPVGVAADASGKVYLTDTGNNRVWTVDANGKLSGLRMPGISPPLNGPTGVAVDKDGNVYVADTGNNRVLKIPVGGGSPLVVVSQWEIPSDFLTAGGMDQLQSPQGVAVDKDGNVYVADTGNNRVLKAASNGDLSVLVTSAQLQSPQGVAVDAAGNVYIAVPGDRFGFIRKLDAQTGRLSTLAGQKFGTNPGDGGPASLAGLSAPQGVAVDAAGNVYFTETSLQRLRMVNAPVGTQFADTYLGSPSTQTLTITNPGSALLTISNIAVEGPSKDQFSLSPTIATVRAGGTLPLSVTFKPIRAGAMSATLSITSDAVGIPAKVLVAGMGVKPPTLSLSPATLRLADTPVGATSQETVTISNPGGVPLNITAIAFDDPDFALLQADAAGKLSPLPAPTVAAPLALAAGESMALMVDFAPSRPGARTATLSVTAGAGVVGSPATVPLSANALPRAILTIAGTGEAGYAGDGDAALGAQLKGPFGMAVDALGNVYFADQSNDRIRRVDTRGRISTFAGGNPRDDLGEDSLATSVRLNGPAGVAADALGNVYIGDTNNRRILKVDIKGRISTLPAQISSVITGIAVDAEGNVYIAEPFNNRISKVKADGTISIVAGPATNAQLIFPSGVAVDKDGNVYIADTGNHRIRKVDTEGTISTIAGSGEFGQPYDLFAGPAGQSGGGFSGDGGPATSARLKSPTGVAVDAAGKVYIADTGNRRIRRVDGRTGLIRTYAGTGTGGFSGDGGLAASARLNSAQSVAVDAAGNVYIADTDNQRLRMVAPPTPQLGLSASALALPDALVGETSEGTVTLSNPGSGELRITGIRVAGADAGEFSVTPAGATTLRAGESATLTVRWTPASVGAKSASLSITHNALGNPATVALSGIAEEGAVISTVFYDPSLSTSTDADERSHLTHVAVDRVGSIYVGSYYRKRGFISFEEVEQILKVNVNVGVIVYTPAKDVAVDSRGNVYYPIMNRFNNDLGGQIFKWDGRSASVVTGIHPLTLAIDPAKRSGAEADTGPATGALLYDVTGVAADGDGNVYFAETDKNRIRRVDARTGQLSVYAGGGNLGDGGPAAQAALSRPMWVDVDQQGNLYILEADNGHIRKVDRQSRVISTAATTTGDARMAVDLSGNVYILEPGNKLVRRLDARTGQLRVYAGGGNPANGDGDNGPPSKAVLSSPVDVAVDGSGNVYITEARNKNSRIRKVAPAPLPQST